MFMVTETNGHKMKMGNGMTVVAQKHPQHCQTPLKKGYQIKLVGIGITRERMIMIFHTKK